MPVEDYTPSLEEVGQVTLGRTVDDLGIQTGTFSEETRPTDDQVTKLILRAVADVRPKIGADIPADLFEDAKTVVSYRTAMLIELTQFGAEVATERSPYPQYKELFKEALGDLINSVEAEEAGADSANTVTATGPAFGFPAVEPLLDKKM